MMMRSKFILVIYKIMRLFAGHLKCYIKLKRLKYYLQYKMPHLLKM